MTVVINLSEYRGSKGDSKRGSWVSGTARCMECAHKWVAVCHKDTRWLECPNCGTEKGRLVYHYEPPEGVGSYSCGCGNDLFILTEEGLLCPSCGNWVEKP